MQNYYTIETEVEFRRREWEHAAAADARAALARPANGLLPQFHLPQFALAQLRSLSAPRLPQTSPLASDCPTPAC
jgi:hypothetical protein